MLNIPTIATADELIGRAFHRAAKVTITDPNRMYRLKKTSIAKLQSVAQYLDAALSGYVKAFPSFDGLHPFQRELLHLLLDLDRLKKALGALDWARKKILELCGEKLRLMRRSFDLNFIDDSREEAYGRVASVMKQVKGDLDFLVWSRERIRKLPTIFPESPTVVIAGYPNVGKSMLVSRLSGAKPEVAPYPFTTKGMIVGHFEHKWRTYQVIDTPGLLDRPLSERNRIELQAILALRHLADVMVFLVDPTGACGASVEEQRELLSQVRKDFPGSAILEVQSKSDLQRGAEGLSVSALTGEGVEELRKRIIDLLKTVKKVEPPSTDVD